MKSTTAEKTVIALEGMFSRHGNPNTISSDNGPQFISETYNDYLEQQGITRHLCTPKWPQANGEVERQNSSIEKRLRIAQAERKDWKRELRKYVTAYRALPHTTTGKSPSELLFGRKVRTKIPQLFEVVQDFEVRDRDAEQKQKSKMYADRRRNAQISPVMVGDEVLVKKDVQNKLDTPFVPEPYEVVDRAGTQVTVESPQGVTTAA